MLIRLKKFLRIAGYVLLSAILVLIFSGLMLANKQSVAVSFWSWTSEPLNLSMVLFLAFFLGACTAVLFCVLAVVRLSLHSRSLQRKLKRRETELQKLRVSALRGLSS